MGGVGVRVRAPPEFVPNTWTYAPAVGHGQQPLTINLMKEPVMVGEKARERLDGQTLLARVPQ
jgi:hypothetical protein